jgi:hypothetical protein
MIIKLKRKNNKILLIMQETNNNNFINFDENDSISEWKTFFDNIYDEKKNIYNNENTVSIENLVFDAEE